MRVRVLLLSLCAAVLLNSGCKTTPTTPPTTSGGGLPSAGSPASGGGTPGSPTPAGSSQGSSMPGTTGGGASGKSVEVLDGELDESLEDFEGRVSGAGAESGTIDILDPSGRNTGGISAGVPVFEEADVGSGDAGDSGTLGDVENADVEERANEGYEGAESDGDTVASSQGAAGGENIPLPDDVGDGQGDDIVLRQIREAAMKEPDPVLREKLWDEYRRIKGQ